MGKPDAAGLGEGIDLGGSLCGGATPNSPHPQASSLVLGPVRRRGAQTPGSSFAPRQAGGVARVAARQAPLPSRAHLAVRLLALRVSSSLQKPLPSSEPVPKVLAGNNRLQLDLPHPGPLTGWKAIPTGMGMGVPQVGASFLVYPLFICQRVFAAYWQALVRSRFLGWQIGLQALEIAGWEPSLRRGRPPSPNAEG